MTDVASTDDSYNELISQRGLRRFYHMARFDWVRDKVERHLDGDIRLVELGCFDGRLLDILGSRVAQYVGVDANWGGGLDIARARYCGRDEATFIESSDPADFDRFGTGQFNLSAALETLEHVPPQLVPAFLDQLQRVTRGHLFVTVPNELGLVFLAKHLVRVLRFGAPHHYSPREVVAATFRQSDKVERNDHKGFDYRNIVAEVGKRFEIVAVEGIASLGLPPALSPTVGIIAKSASNIAKS
jgi:hypothetical protein